MPAQPDPNADDTAVLPHIEGPPLVRPYVPAPSFEPEYGQQPTPVQDPFATTVLPPVAKPQPMQSMQPMPPVPPVPPMPPVQPPSIPASPPPAPPQAMTTVLPPVPAEPPVEEWEVEDQHRGRADLGMFAFHEDDDQRPGGRAERRSRQHAEDTRRRALIIGAGVGIAAVGAGLALLVSPSDSGKGKNDQALPAPTGSLWAPSPSDPSPTAAPSTGTASTPAKPSPVHSTIKAPLPASKPPVVVPTTQPPSPVPVTTTPSATPSPRTLKMGDQGQDVAQMQQMLVYVYCGTVDPQLISGTFDWQTRNLLTDYQRQSHVKGENGVYGPATRNSLTRDASDPNFC